jgi:protein-L-isoaspartate(D-aspartate) O-methyltransferase
MDFERARFNMIEQQIRPWDVFDPEALETLASVKRELFVPEALRAQAFTDTQLPIGKGQSMLEPKVEAKVLQALAIKPGDKVLEVGTGSGSMAALLALRAEWVRTVEIEPELAALAQRALRSAGADNVTVEQGDGLAGWPISAPYDAIVLSGGVQQVPAVLFDQLAVGGRLFAFVGRSPVMQATLYTKTGDGQIRKSVVFDTLVPELHPSAHSGFSF